MMARGPSPADVWCSGEAGQAETRGRSYLVASAKLNGMLVRYPPYPDSD
jgi:hypothetical protein